MARRQVSLYIKNCPEIESLRRQVNPVQAAFIPPHVTLCREDEVDNWAEIYQKLQALMPLALTLRFGNPERDGNFVYLPVVAGQDQYQRLRESLLMPGCRQSVPHLTLIHPRNGTCDNQIYSHICNSLSEFPYTFREAKLIEENVNGVWSEIPHDHL